MLEKPVIFWSNKSINKIDGDFIIRHILPVGFIKKHSQSGNAIVIINRTFLAENTADILLLYLFSGMKNNVPVVCPSCRKRTKKQDKYCQDEEFFQHFVLYNWPIKSTLGEVSIFVLALCSAILLAFLDIIGFKYRNFALLRQLSECTLLHRISQHAYKYFSVICCFTTD